ncbi:DUF4145 domain-containing protein [Thioclava sp. 15-R06ZXC-3]|uniref:DUF4145 domain-containing protein n=1 Tax=Thioclava arctica TaxID=3238301 RepID=A0ABV3TFX7_9RHOB
MYWECPYCGQGQTVTSPNFSQIQMHFEIEKPESGEVGLRGQAIRCANPECNRLEIRAEIVRAAFSSGHYYIPTNAKILHRSRLLPPSFAKVLPDFIPAVLRDDYEEACKICDLSPKASATLARRCLQGMIRDFCGISKNRLIDEVNALRKLLADDNAPRGVSEESVEAIDAVRDIGNIGAHMEKDISVIIEVDADEARTLIELIELLFEEWYIAREKRRMRLSKVVAIKEAKDSTKLIAKEASNERPNE